MFLVAVPSPSYRSRPTLLILPQPLTVFSLSFLVHLDHLVAHILAQQTFQSLLSVAIEQAWKRNAVIPWFKGGQSSLPETSNQHMAEMRQ